MEDPSYEARAVFKVKVFGLDPRFDSELTTVLTLLLQEACTSNPWNNTRLPMKKVVGMSSPEITSALGRDRSVIIKVCLRGEIRPRQFYAFDKWVQTVAQSYEAALAKSELVKSARTHTLWASVKLERTFRTHTATPAG